MHLGFAFLFLLLVMGFKAADNPSMIGVILKLAGYTYGPLLGLFAFGMLTGARAARPLGAAGGRRRAGPVRDP